MYLMSLSVGICKNDLDLDSFFKRSNPFHPSLTVNKTKLNSNTKFFKTKKFNVWIPQLIFFPTSIRSIRWLFQVFEEQKEAVFVLLGTFRHQRKKNWKKKQTRQKCGQAKQCETSTIKKVLARPKHHWLFIQLKTWPVCFRDQQLEYFKTFSTPTYVLPSRVQIIV